MKQKTTRIYAHFLGVLFFVLLSSLGLMAQIGTPTYSNNFLFTGSNNAFPLNSATSNKVQWIYGPGTFATSGAAALGSGNNITKIYIKFGSGTQVPAKVYTDMTLSLKQTGTATAHSSTTFETGMTQVFTATNFSFAGAAASLWYGFTITPFLYDPSQSLIVELKTNNITTGGCSVPTGTTTGGTQRRYAAFAATTGTNGTGLMPLGLDVIPASGCTSPPTPGTATVTPSSGVCPGATVALNLTSNSLGSGQTYSWESSSTIGGTYSPVSGATSLASPTVNIPAPSSNLYYRCQVTCSGNTQLSTSVLLSPNPLFASGTYTINSAVATGGGNYQTFSDAIAAIGCGITGPVVFNVQSGSGPYIEQIDIPTLAGTSAINTVTFNCNNTTLSFGGGVTYYSTLNISGADYLRFNDLNVIATGATNSWAIHLMNNSDNNIFTSCTASADITATVTTVQSFIMNGSNTVYSTGGSGGNFNTFNNCTFTGGYYGVTLYGATGAGNGNTGNTFDGCTLSEAYGYSSYNLYTTAGVFSNCIIERPSRTTTTTSAGIYLSTGCFFNLIEKCRVRNMFGGTGATTGTFYGLYASVVASAGNENKFYNNAIYDINFNGSLYGLYLGTGTFINAYHNTINFDDAASTSTAVCYGIYSTASGTTNIDARNNMITISRGGTGIKACTYLGSTSTISNNNNFVNTALSGTNNIGSLSGAGQATMALWKASNSNAFDQASTDINPLYLNAAAGDFTPLQNSLNGIGANVGITSDIIGLPRGTTPDPGCYEFTPAPCIVPPTAGTATINNAISCTTTTITLDLVGSTYGYGQTYQWYSSSTIGGSYTPLSGIQSLSLYMPTVTASAFYKCEVICSGNAQFSSIIGNIVYPALAGGTYTVNSAIVTGGTNYQNFADLITAAACGISGPIIVNVASGSGPYNEQVDLGVIIGASALNTITINGNGCTLTQTLTTTGANYATLNLDGSDFITVNNLIIEALGGTYGFAVHLMNGADNNTFNNCTFRAAATSTVTTSAAVSMSGSRISYSTQGINGMNNTFDGCTFTGGYFGFTNYGNSGTTIGNTNNVVKNSNITDFYVYGAYCIYNSGTTFSNNIISRPTRTATTTVYGIFTTTGCVNMLIEKNRIRDLYVAVAASTTTYGIYCISTAATAGNENKIYNNIISNIVSNFTLYGIYLTTGTYVWAYNNTISFDNTAATGTGITYGTFSTGANCIFKNNNIYITQGGTGIKYGIYHATATANSDYNNVYVNGAGGGNNYGYSSSTSLAYASRALWTAAFPSLDANSKELNPIFTNPATYNYTPLNANLDNLATVIAAVPTDINGAIRSATTPDIGAYEFTVPLIDLGVTGITTPNTSGCYSNTEAITVTLFNYGANPIDFSTLPATITCNITGATTATLIGTPSGILAPATSMSLVLTGTLNMTINGAYTIDAFSTISGDGNAGNDAMPTTTRTKIAIVSGTISSGSQNPICISGTPVISLSGNNGSNNIQWQESAVSASGPWTNVGSNSNIYTPAAPITQQTFYNANVQCYAASSNTNQLTFNVSNPIITSVTNGSSCGPGTVALSVNGTGASQYNWYSTPVSNVQLNTTANYTTPSISSTTSYYVTAATGTLNNSLSSAFVGGNGSSANFFDIIPATNMTINRVDVNTSSIVSTPVTIYYRVGTCIGNATAPGPGWILLSTFNVIGAGSNNHTICNFPTGVTLPLAAGTTYALAIGIAGMQYTNATAGAALAGTTHVSNADLVIKAGYGGTLVSTIIDRNWNGQIFYSTGCESARSTVVATVNPAPTTTISVAGANSITLGQSTTLSVALTGAGPWNYILSDGSTHSAATSPNVVSVTPTTSTVYTVTSVSSSICTTTSSSYLLGSAAVAVHAINDDCSNAINLNIAPACSNVSGTSFNGFPDAIASSCSGVNADDAVWYKCFKPSGVTSLTFKVQGGSNFDPAFEILSGTCAAPTSVACVNNSALTTNNIESYSAILPLPAAIYFIRVFDARTLLGGGNGNFQICVTGALPVPTNDNPCTGTNISGNSGSVANTTQVFSYDGGSSLFSGIPNTPTANPPVAPNLVYYNGTTSFASNMGAAEPTPSCGTSGLSSNSVWFSFKAPMFGAFDVTLRTGYTPTNFTTILTAYTITGSVCGTPVFTQIPGACSTTGTLLLNGNATVPSLSGLGGQQIYIQLMGDNATAGTYQLSLAAEAPPVNPVSLSTSSATLSLPTISGMTSLKMYLKAVGSTGFSVYNVAGNPTSYTFGSLASGANYLAWASYSNGIQTFYTPVVPFTTTTGCSGPLAAPSEAAVVGHCAQRLISWPTHPLAAVSFPYRLYSWKPATTNIYVVALNTTSFTLSSLALNTAYNAYYKVICNGGAQVNSGVATYTTCAGPAKEENPVKEDFIVWHNGIQFVNPTIEDLSIIAEGVDLSDGLPHVIAANGLTEAPNTTVKAATTSVSKEFVFEIVPNPNAGQFMIQLNENLKIEEELTVSIFNASGSRVMTEKVRKPNNENQIALNLADYKEGVYLVTIQNAQFSQTKKLVIAR